MQDLVTVLICHSSTEFSLKYARAHLENADLADDDDVSELHSHLCQLCVEYETKLLFLLSSNQLA